MSNDSRIITTTTGRTRRPKYREDSNLNQFRQCREEGHERGNYPSSKWRDDEICLTCYRDLMNEKAKVRHRELRVAALAAYGHACKCCGEANEIFLCFDHVAGDGREHRNSLIPPENKSAKGNYIGSGAMLRWMKRENYPDSIRILCHNCNFAQGHGGCPHGNLEPPPVPENPRKAGKAIVHGHG